MDWATHIMSLQWYMVLFLPPECVEDFKRLKKSNHEKLFIKQNGLMSWSLRRQSGVAVCQQNAI
jgi:hypothetical protein